RQSSQTIGTNSTYTAPMHRASVATVFSILLTLSGVAALAQGPKVSTKALIIDKSCVDSSFGECFRFHARFTVYTGDGQEVLWPVGTHRLLRSLSDNEPLYSVIMGGEESETRQFEEMAGKYAIMGDFLVCPRAKEVAGAMRNVCIQ